MRALIAFDKFKDALTAQDACLCAQKALLAQRPDTQIEIAPLADGGDGFCNTLTAIAGGTFTSQEVVGPLGQKTTAKYGNVSASSLRPEAIDLLQLPANARQIAIIELAQTSGIALTPLENRSPWITHTHGLGELIAASEKRGADCILIGLGGSATHDLACGALQALGFRFYQSDDTEIADFPTPETWDLITRIQAPDIAATTAIRIACDVDNPLIGPNGAAAIFGPQKGLEKKDFERLDALTAKMAQLLSNSVKGDPDEMDTPGAGAAGGAAYGLKVGLGGKIISGFQLVDAWSGLSRKLETADIVITGEGRFDASSLGGKGPGSLAKEALRLGKETHIFAGSLSKDIASTLALKSCNAISPADLPLPKALKQTKTNLSNAIAKAFKKHT